MTGAGPLPSHAPGRETGTAATLRVAAPDDLPFVLATERGEGYEHLVGRSTEALHRAEMENPGSVFLLGARADGPPLGFANLRGLDDPHGNVLLRRIALARPGEGFGRAFLRALQGWVFARATAHRFWLDVYEDNHRAQAAYRAAGFRQEGVMREIYLREGLRVSAHLMAILRPEWEALRADDPGAAASSSAPR